MSDFIGIDIGASFVKGAVFNLETSTIHSIVKHPSPQNEIIQSSSTPLRFEVDVKQYLGITKKIIETFVDRSDNVEGIVFSTQMHGMILVDSKNNPLSPFIGWQDERLLETDPKTKKTWMDQIRERLKAVDTVRTGINMRSGLMGSTLFWLQAQGQLPQGSKALFLGDYIAAALTSGKTSVDATNACGSGLYDTQNGSWDPNICQALEIPVSVLPEIVPTGFVVGNMSISEKDVPVYVSVGDLQAAVLGSLLRPTTEVSINIGTGSQVSTIQSAFSSGNYDIRSFFDKTYLYTVTHLPAGRALNVIISFIKHMMHEFADIDMTDLEIWEKAQQVLSKKKNSEQLKADISFFKNNTTGAQSGSFSSVTEQNFTIENILYASFENMANNYSKAFNRLPNHNKVKKIMCSGGVVRQLEPLRDLIHKEFGKPLELARYDEETLVGLYILAMYSSHDFDTIKAASEYVINKPIQFEKYVKTFR